MGCRTETAAVLIAHVLQRFHFFEFFHFFCTFHNLPQKKITRPYRKKKFHFFYNSHDILQKNYMHLPQKLITRLDDFFHTTYIFDYG